MKRSAWALSRTLDGLSVTANGSLGTNPNGPQCVNVPNALWELVGAEERYGNAVDWLGVSSARVRWFSFSPRLRLRAGDVAVWGSSPSAPFGHVDVVLDGSTDPFLGLDQNYPIGSVVHHQSHPRAGLAGVLRVQKL
jgi:hypothetical protein